MSQTIMKESPIIFVIASYVSALSMHVTRFPQAGESLKSDGVVLEAGGKGLNVAVAARRLGATVGGLIAIGDDRLSAMALDAMIASDLPEGMVVRIAGPSGMGVGLIDASGENMIAVHPGANEHLAAAHVHAAIAQLEPSDAIVAQFEVGDDPIEAAFAIARARGIRTILNPSPYRAISPAILSKTDILVVNRPEAGALLASFGSSSLEQSTETKGGILAKKLFEQGVSALVITLGKDGACFWGPENAFATQPAFPCDAKDTTGCGDAFLAGISVAVTEGQSWPEALRLAAACGAVTASRSGVLDALPTRATVESMLATNGNLEQTTAEIS